MNKGIWAIIVVAAFVGGTISVNPLAEAANPFLEEIQATVNDIETETDKIQMVKNDVGSIKTTVTNFPEPMNQVLVKDYSGSVSLLTSKATSTGPFIFHICARNDNNTIPDSVFVTRTPSIITTGGSIAQARIDEGATGGFIDGDCITVGGRPGDTINIGVSQLDGTSQASATLITTTSATASLT